MSPSMILDLPNELLLQLPECMQNIEDFKNLASTCTKLRAVFADTLPKTILRLAANSAPTFFSPHPHFLVLSVARQIATWALAVQGERETRTARLLEAFRGGVIGVLELALDDGVEVGLSMADIRRMHLARYSVINPLNDTIDAMIGSTWYAQPNFWNGGAEDAFTLYANVSTTTMELLIYGEFFGPTMSSFLLPKERRTPALGVDERLEFVKYCIPDWICKDGSRRRHDGFEVQAIGPYAPDIKYSQLYGNQTALVHLLGRGVLGRGVLWGRAWRRVLIAVGAESNDDGKWPEKWIKELQKIEWRKRRGRSGDPGEVVVGAEDDANPGSGAVAEERVAGDVSVEQAHDGTQEIAEEEVGEDENENGNKEEEDEQNEGEEEGEEEEEEEDDDDDENNEDEDDDEEEDEDENWTYDSAPESEPESGASLDDWRFNLFWNALTQAGGLRTLSTVAQFKGREEGRDIVVGPEEKAQILRLRDQVLALRDEDEPGFKKVGKRRKLKVSEAPNLAVEAYWCCAGMWGGL